ncbi:MAG: DUF58 domain-containing protein [Planctomycetes bacterium]|nr:DUF58 domain-containing protein [Planctomycetota bacterium]
MLPREFLRHIRHIEIRTQRAVNDVLAGQYESVFRGAGIAFEEVREYQPGDDVRTIDWNVTARMGHPYVKRFREEREQTVVLLVDASASQTFGTTERWKNEVAAELCALLAFSAVKNNDKVGVILFSDHVEHFVAAAKGTRHVLRLIRDVLYFQPAGRGTDIATALGYLRRVTHRRAIVFLLSDFLASGFERPLRVAARRHEVIAVRLVDPRERELPPGALVDLEDAETGQRITVDTGSRAFREQYARLATTRAAQFQQLCRSANIDAIEVRTEGRYVDPLVRFFRRREVRTRR